MLLTFFNSKFLPWGQIINRQVYKEILQHYLVHEKRLDLYQDKLWLLHHNNAPAHKALLVRQFLTKKSILILEQPPNSPDLALCDFFLFPKLKRNHQVNSFWRHGGYLEDCNNRAKGHPKRILPAVAENDEKVH